MELQNYLLIAVILFLVALYPLGRRLVGLMDLFVKKYVQSPVEDKETTARALFNLRLVAYERIVLFLERIKPDSLIPRTLLPDLSCSDYHSRLIHEIRQEYEYNLSQQLYMSTEAWEATSNFKNNVVTLINSAAAECRPEEVAGVLAKKILELYIVSDIKAEYVVQLVKEEIKKQTV